MKNEKDKNKNSDGEGAKEKSFKKNTSQINKDEKNGETSNGNRGSEISDSQKSGKKDKSNSVDTLIGYVVFASIIIGLLSGVYKFIWYGDLDI
jgi:hypothetical protein